MNTKQTKIRTALLLALVLASSAALAGQHDDYAQVGSVTSEYERFNSPRQECHGEYVPGPARGEERSYGGSVIGGITGAIVGNQVGGGHGREAAAAASSGELVLAVEDDGPGIGASSLGGTAFTVRLPLLA